MHSGHVPTVWCFWSVIFFAISACGPGAHAFAALNEHCNSTCFTTHSVCVQVSGKLAGFCACIKGFRATWDGRRCVTERCYLDEHCDLPNEVCNKETARCSCLELHVRSHESYPCVPPLGRTCSSPGDCLKYVTHSQCLNETCACKEKFVPSQNSTLCLPTIGSQCSDDVHCRVKHSYCNAGICKCQRSPVRFVLSADSTACLPEVPDLHAACSQHSQCIRASSDLGGPRWCVNRECVCRYGITLPNTTHCEVRRGLADACTHTQQCQEVSRALCVRGKCACEPGFSPHPAGTICLSSLLGRCKGNDECFVPDDGEAQRVECRNGTCGCKSGFRSTNSLGCDARSAGSEGNVLRVSWLAVLCTVAVTQVTMAGATAWA